MSRRLKIAAIASWALSATLLLPEVARAGPGDGSGQGSGGSSGGVLTAGVTFETGGGSGGGGGGDGCTYTLFDGAINVPSMGSATWPRIGPDGRVFHMYSRRCPDGNLTYLELPEIDPVDLLPLALERLKSKELPKPAPVFELLDPQFGWAYVRTPLDYRAGGNSWRTVSVTARIGPFWATVTAEPTLLRFESGDPAGPWGDDCDGDGPVAPYVVEVPGACSYTYTNASSTSPFDGYHFLTTLAIDWRIAWTSSTPGRGGPLDPYSTSSTAELAVAEVKGLVVCTGARPEQGGC